MSPPLQAKTHKGPPALSYASGTTSSCLSTAQRALTSGYTPRTVCSPNARRQPARDPLDTKENNND